ncbi:MAG: CHASE3 domain-containing protein [Verrucomicrobia bacterium]|nr:CHASE3 domain-containing protein [Verrucomicrobiota bacterium]
MQLSVTRKVVLAFSLSFAILCVIGVVAVQNIRTLIGNMDLVARSYRVMGELSETSNLAKDIQSAVRGYVITGNEEFLDPYQTSREAIHGQIREVEALVQNKPPLARQFEELKSLIRQQLDYVSRTIEVRKQEGLDAAMERVRAGEGERRIEDIRRISRAMDSAENNLLAARAAEASRSVRETLTVIVTGSALSLLLVAAATLIIARDIRERERLEKAVLDAGEREQRRIGQDLHDGLCQQLAGGAFMCRALEEELTPTAPHEAATAGRISELLNRAVNHARGLARGLHPVELEAGGLMSALEELAANVNEFFSVACRFECPHPVLVLDNTVAVHVFRIAQEAIHNAVRHGKPQNVEVSLTGARGAATLEIRDDGSGLPPEAGRRRGMGLDTMRYRANAIGATLDIRAGNPGGTIVTCAFRTGPLPPSAH